MAKVAADDRSVSPEDAAERAGARAFGRRGALQSPNEALQPQPAPPPPERRHRRRPRRTVLSTLSGILSFVLVLAVGALIGIGSVAERFAAPGPLANDKVVFIAKGTSRGDITDQLEREGVTDDALMLNAGLLLASLRRSETPKAGEYLFKSHVSLAAVINTLLEGKPLQRKVTLPEGLTSQQIVDRLKELKDEEGNPLLKGDMHVPKEGTLMPDTYEFARGDTGESVLKRMQDRQKEVLNEVWARRAADVPIKSTYDLVTLASIVEKETGKADERPRVAGVFVNRLTRHMKLQSDPTIIYGLVGGKGTLGRPILKSEVEASTPYNTYVIDGLPPGPICNPGRAAMEAVGNPAKTKELYFVADGTGGHAFAETIDEHLKNVARWR
ncbi:MAG: endolytic transglycosylase MltG, partial [Methylobacteriaceae bacterium]|nr:endolytic transglycosylase MltG [Methylobacteriaceae bacterium]